MTSVRDWQLHGVDLKVELATSGELVYGGTTTLFPFETGGLNGVPLYWSFYEAGEAIPTPANYNLTTASGVFSISIKTLPPTGRSAGIYSFAFPIKPGYRYMLSCQAKRMDAYVNPVFRNMTFQRSNDGGQSWTYSGGSGSAYALNDWEDLNSTTNPIPAGFTLGRWQLFGGPQTNTNTIWGVQFKDLLILELAPEPAPLVWHDITCDVRSLAIRYGRERFTNRYDAGTLQVVLNNDDGEYTYQTAHPLNLRPGRQVRVIASYEDVSYPLAFGILDSITEGYSLDGRVVSTWQCVDPTTILSNKTTETGSTATVKSGKRINNILDQSGYAFRDLDEGVWYTDGLHDSGRSLRDEAGVTADSEGAAFFAERNGTIVYRDRNWRTTDPMLMNVTADMLARPDGPLEVVDQIPTLPDAPAICLSELQTDWSLARVMNIVSLANAGGTAQTFIDEASVSAHGPHTYERMDFVLRGNSPDPLPIRAADLMDGYANPVLRVTSLSFAPGLSGDWAYCLSVFLNWMVRVWYMNEQNDWGYAVAVHVQSVEHRITPSDWSMTMAVDVPESFVEIEDNDFGWDMGLWDDALWDQVAVAGALWSDPEYTWSTAGDNWGE